jgi:hypothetical protein
MRRSASCTRAMSAVLAVLSAARGDSLRCDTPGVAQLIIPSKFAQTPDAKKLGLEGAGEGHASLDRAR